MKFIKLHEQGAPRLVNLDTVSLFFVQGGKTKVCFDGEEYIFVDERLDDVAKIIYEAEVAGSNSETATGEWISVEERLPETSGHYYAHLRTGLCDVFHYSAKHKAFNAHDSLDHCDYAVSVTYWMPLPEPPKGVTE